MGNFPSGGREAREPLQILHPEKRKVRFPHPGRRRIHHEGTLGRPSRRTRRSSFPLSPRVAHRERTPQFFAHVEFPAREIPSPPPPARRGSAEAAHEGGAESPDRAAHRRAAPRRADSFFGKNAFPAPASIGFIMGPSRSRSAPSRPARVRRGRLTIPPLRFRGFGRPSFSRMWNFPTGSPPAAEPLQISVQEKKKTHFPLDVRRRLRYNFSRSDEKEENKWSK